MGEDLTRPLTLTLTLTLTPNRSKNGAKLAINAAAPVLASNEEFSQLLIVDDDFEVQTALRNYRVKNTPKDHTYEIAKPTLKRS